jgi:hypothetical protein
MQQVRLLRIVMASPGDVAEEREVLDKVIAKLNRSTAADRGVRLEISRWETDAFPGFHPSGPQGLIDSVLQVENCDILIAIFWKRFGTPVPDAGSGTEHEIRAAVESWRQRERPDIMMYFNEKPWNPSTPEEVDQLRSVLWFKKNFPKEGLWWSYNGVNDFEDKVWNHLTQFLRNRVPLTAATAATQAAAEAEKVSQHAAPHEDIDLILAHFDDLAGSYEQMAPRPDWTPASWRSGSLRYRLALQHAGSGLSELQRIQRTDGAGAARAVALRNACSAALEELDRVRRHLNDLMDDRVSPWQRNDAARLFATHATRLNERLARIQTTVRERNQAAAVEAQPTEATREGTATASAATPNKTWRLGDLKLLFSKRLGDSWTDLANALDIPSYKQSAFRPGEEPAKILDWLSDRGELPLLRDALIRIDRKDLANELPEGLR